MNAISPAGRTKSRRRPRPTGACHVAPAAARTAAAREPASGPRAHVRRPPARRRPTAALIAERGDVPGWVLVTLMTAGLVVALWAVAGPALTQVFLDAIAKVTGAI